jgi:hypothetical protein
VLVVFVKRPEGQMYLERIKERFEQAPTPLFKPEGVVLEQIVALETKMALRFPAAYTEFLEWMGGNASLLLNNGMCNFADLPTFNKEVAFVLWSYGTDDAELSLSKTDLVFWKTANSYRFYLIEARDNPDPPVYYADAQKLRFGFSQTHFRLTDFISEALEREIAARL